MLARCGSDAALAPPPLPPTFPIPDALQKGDPSSTDLVFTVEGQRLHFSKAVLTMCSPVFKALLTPEYVRRHGRAIPLGREKKYNAVAFFFIQLHPVFSALTPLQDDMLEETLALAEEYQVDHLSTKCEAYMDNRLELCEAKQAVTADRVLHYLSACETHHLNKLRERAVKLAAEMATDTLQGSHFFKSAPATALRDVLVLRCRALEKELDSFKGETKRKLRAIASQINHAATYDDSSSTLDMSVENIQSLMKSL